jgi:glycosyltransferase XagB
MSKHGREALARRRGRGEKMRDPSSFAIGRTAKAARDHLATANSKQSAKRPAGRVMVALICALTVAAIFGALGVVAFAQVWTLIAGLFASVGILRALACAVPVRETALPPSGQDINIVPVWTLLIALYDEADSVPSLLAALSKLTWGDGQLDVIFACEIDDTPTLEALTTLQNTHDFRIVRVPKGGPRTKPNALQTALPFARGRFISVYDAEDRPDPNQLRAAFHAFATGPSDLAVVQAPLVAWNHTESWIARQFALDYAIWFRVMLPALSRLSGVLPLGGTSNHFRTEALIASGGWDPYNVTEDADLGIRLGRLGYRAALITPPTLEEAPPRVGAWVKQRGRWIQGHIQTVSVHLREPLSLAKALNWRGLSSLALGLGIGPLSALCTVPLSACLIAGVLGRDTAPLNAMTTIMMALGILCHVLACVVGAQRDGRLALLTSCVTLPLYYSLQSLAACRAIWRVVFTPTIWDKTDHGCAARKGVATSR